MTIRTRKLVGTIALLVFLIPYWFVVVAIAAALQVAAHKWLEPIFYVVGGLAWVVPAAWLVRWMQKPDEASGDPAGK